MKRFDQSPVISERLQNLSTGLSRRRGLPLMVGIGLVVLSLFVHILLALIPGSVLLSVLAFLILHIAILVGFISIAIMEPIGRG